MTLLTDIRKGNCAPCIIALCQEDNRVWMNGKPCHLTTQEYRLLHALARCAPDPCTRDELLCEAWDYANPGKSRTVDVHVQRLRRKMGDSLFETVHGVGYRLKANAIQV